MIEKEYIDFQKTTARIRVDEKIKQLQKQVSESGTADMTEEDYKKMQVEKSTIDSREAALYSFGKTVESIQKKSAERGTDKISMDEINAEIEAYRREERGL
ncbi:MAG: hypothetical protein FWC91_09790 [Defluviitaleaceae bacterium]|nr:hypothetical protein [Defluviitaleaceae bacterium]